MPKKCPLIFIIDDDEGASDCKREDALEVIPRATVKIFVDALSASKATGSPDFIIIDISAVGSIAGGPHHSYSAICNLACKHPGAMIIINSAVSRYFAEEVRDLVKERCPESVIELVDWAKCDPGDSLKKILKEAI
jgi:hypothetical protein